MILPIWRYLVTKKKFELKLPLDNLESDFIVQTDI